MMETKRTLIRTDKNGTRYYSFTCPCAKCNGRGYIDHYKHVEAGVCFDCNGSGIYEGTEKVYTEEYLAKKAKMAEKRAEKRRDEFDVEKELARMGYGPEIGIVTNANGKIDYGEDFEWLTKHAGCKYEKWGCHAIVTSVGNTLPETAGYQILPVRWDELLKVGDGVRGPFLIWKEDGAKEAVKAHTYSYPPKPKFESAYVGAEGEKVELTLQLVKVGGYESSFGGRTVNIAVYTFEDEHHNKLVWKTQKGIEGEICDFFKVKGTVKEHSEYLGEKQTVLTRCKVEAA